MGRFFRTSNVQGIDFVDEGNADFIQDTILKISDRKESNLDAASKLLDTLPLDSTDASREKLESINATYNAEIDNITKELTEGNISNSEASKRIREQQRALKTSIQTGELKAIRENAIDYNNNVALIREQFKNAPHVMQAKLRELKANSANTRFDDSLGTFDPIQVPTVHKHYTGDQIGSQLNTSLKNIEADFVRLTDGKVQSIDEFHKLFRLGQVNERTYSKIAKALGNQIPQDIINSVQQESDALGLGIDETKFIDDNGNLDLNTTLGKMIHGVATGGATKKITDKSQVLGKSTPTGSTQGENKKFNSTLKGLEGEDRFRAASILLEDHIRKANKEYAKDKKAVSRKPFVVREGATERAGLIDFEILPRINSGNLANNNKDDSNPILYRATILVDGEPMTQMWRADSVVEVKSEGQIKRFRADKFLATAIAGNLIVEK